MNVALYVRVSTIEQAEEGYSIDEQISRLTKYAESHDWKVIKVYTDPGYSGGNMNRPALQEMIREIDSVDCVLVYKLDRLSRSQKDTLYLIEDVFSRHGVSFVSMSENYDTNTPFGKAMTGILAVFAQLERENIKSRMAMGKEGRAKEGLWHGGGKCPIGYDYTDGHLVVNEFESLAVQEAHRLYNEGNSIKEIEREFERRGYASKYGRYTARRLSEILTNEIYIGVIKRKGNKYQGVHDHILTDEVFEKTQKRYQTRYHTRNKGAGSLLGGLLYCKRCGARYALNMNSKYRYYCCHSRRKTTRSMIRDPECRNKIYKEQELNDMVLGEIQKISVSPKKEIEKRDTSIPLRREIEKIDKQRLRLLDLYSTGLYSMEELQNKIRPLEERKEALQKQITAPRTSPEEARKLFKDYKDIIKTGDLEDIRYLVHMLIDKIEIDGDDIYIYWAF